MFRGNNHNWHLMSDGGPWMPFFPSRSNALAPVRSRGDAIDIVAVPHLARDKERCEVVLFLPQIFLVQFLVVAFSGFPHLEEDADLRSPWESLAERQQSCPLGTQSRRRGN